MGKNIYGMTHDQSRFVLDRLRECRYHHQRRDDPTPKSVRAAEKLVERWRKNQRRLSDIARRKVDRAKEKLERKVLATKNFEEALKIIDGFKARKF